MCHIFVFIYLIYFFCFLLKQKTFSVLSKPFPYRHCEERIHTVIPSYDMSSTPRHQCHDINNSILMLWHQHLDINTSINTLTLSKMDERSLPVSASTSEGKATKAPETFENFRNWNSLNIKQESGLKELHLFLGTSGDNHNLWCVLQWCRHLKMVLLIRVLIVMTTP